MLLSSSYHVEFSGLERDLFMVRESVLYGPDFGQSELAAIVVKNSSKKKVWRFREVKNHSGCSSWRYSYITTFINYLFQIIAYSFSKQSR